MSDSLGRFKKANELVRERKIKYIGCSPNGTYYFKVDGSEQEPYNVTFRNGNMTCECKNETYSNGQNLCSHKIAVLISLHYGLTRGNVIKNQK
jgi:uncharacterized Zn finger protein